MGIGRTVYCPGQPLRLMVIFPPCISHRLDRHFLHHPQYGCLFRFAILGQQSDHGDGLCAACRLDMVYRNDVGPTESVGAEITAASQADSLQLMPADRERRQDVRDSRICDTTARRIHRRRTVRRVLEKTKHV